MDGLVDDCVYSILMKMGYGDVVKMMCLNRRLNKWDNNDFWYKRGIFRDYWDRDDWTYKEKCEMNYLCDVNGLDDRNIGVLIKNRLKPRWIMELMMYSKRVGVFGLPIEGDVKREVLTIPWCFDYINVWIIDYMAIYAKRMGEINGPFKENEILKGLMRWVQDVRCFRHTVNILYLNYIGIKGILGYYRDYGLLMPCFRDDLRSFLVDVLNRYDEIEDYIRVLFEYGLDIDQNFVEVNRLAWHKNKRGILDIINIGYWVYHRKVIGEIFFGELFVIYLHGICFLGQGMIGDLEGLKEYNKDNWLFKV